MRHRVIIIAAFVGLMLFLVWFGGFLIFNRTVFSSGQCGGEQRSGICSGGRCGAKPQDGLRRGTGVCAGDV